MGMDEMLLLANGLLKGNVKVTRPMPLQPKDWMSIRSAIHEVVESRHLNDLADKKLANFDYDSFFAASDSLLDFGEIIWFTQSRQWPSNLHEGYLWLVGTLQSLTVIRDASVQFSKCLGVVKIEPADRLFAIANELRVAAIGHPSNHSRNQISGATFLTRTMSKPGVFEIGTYLDNGKFLTRKIDMASLIADVELGATIYMRHCYNALIHSEIFKTPNLQCFDDVEINK
jgi:hypothetical protein